MVFHTYFIVHQYFDLQAETRTRTHALLWTIKHVFFHDYFLISSPSKFD
jgi:hypothetical protein